MPGLCADLDETAIHKLILPNTLGVRIFNYAKIMKIWSANELSEVAQVRLNNLMCISTNSQQNREEFYE